MGSSVKGDVLSTELVAASGVTLDGYLVEASDLRGRFDPARGLTVRSATNGARWAYHVAHVEVDPEGDVLWWLCKASHVGLPNVVVFND